MREIKFRAWHENKMYYLDWAKFHIYRKSPIMQYTGLQDKNGKEIYEGDIVRILYTDWGSKEADDERTIEQYLIDIAKIGVIVFEDCEYQIKFKSAKYDSFYHDTIFCGKHGYIEVIGNIHENSELMEV